MIKVEPVMTLRKNLGEILNKVEYKHDTIIITRAGKPSVAIIDIQLFDKIKNIKNKFQSLTSELQNSFSEYTDEKTDILLNEAINAIKTR